MHDVHCKVVTAGQSHAGKTAIVRQLVDKNFMEKIPKTIGADFKSYILQADGADVRLQIWDTPGWDRFRSVAKAYFRNAVGAILVFDLTDRDSFQKLNGWLSDLKQCCEPNVVIILVGNKSDMIDSRQVSEREINDFATQHNLQYIEVSAKTGRNIENVFRRCAQECIRRNRTRPTPASLRPGTSSTMESEAGSTMESEASSTMESEARDSLLPRTFQVPGAERLRQMACLGESDFTFVVAGHEYPCSRFQAVFMSQRVCRLLRADALADRIVIDLPVEGGSVDEIMSLMNGESIMITEENLEFVEKCAGELENDYLLQEVARIPREEKLDTSNVLERIQSKKESHLDCTKEYEYLAANFYDLDTELIEHLSIDDLDQVLASDKLILESEDELFCVVNGMIEEHGAEYTPLLRHVRFPLLEKDNQRLFLDMASSDTFDCLWPQIRQCLETFSDSLSKPSVFAEGRKYRDGTHT